MGMKGPEEDGSTEAVAKEGEGKLGQQALLGESFIYRCFSIDLG